MLCALKNREQKIESVATTKDAVEYMSCPLIILYYYKVKNKVF